MRLNITIFLVLLGVFLNCRAMTVQEEESDSPDWMGLLLNKYKGFGPTFKCFGCTLILNALVEYTTVNSINVDEFLMNDFCKLFPAAIQPACKTIINEYGAQIITSLLNSASPDQACRDIKICVNPQCNLKPKNIFEKVNLSPNWPHYVERYYPTSDVDATAWLKALAYKTANNTPSIDIDGDFYSASEGELRGFNWRGRDCNDLDANIHPGRKVNPFPSETDDYNCNGISGKDPSSGQDYETLFCNNTNQIGVMVMGDSAGAHCEIPAQWMNGSAWNSTMFSDILAVILDEVDLPHMSGFTGYADVGKTGPVSSVYKYMVERNKCNFRDYANIAVNGAASADSFGNIEVMRRDPANDQPLLIFLELIGNDVCDHTPSFDVMTTPAQFQENVIKLLDYIDTHVPAGSHLVVLGLVNGSMVYEGVKDHTHPSGVTYSQYYDFSNCIEASFCWGWLNTNATVRDLTTQRAMQLNQVWQSVLSNYTAKNYDSAYYDFPAQPIWDQWVAAGKDPYDLIEPADGFHPNQMLHSLLGDWLWNTLLQDHADWLGEENPNNDQITQIFGDQGGY